MIIRNISLKDGSALIAGFTRKEELSRSLVYNPDVIGQRSRSTGTSAILAGKISLTSIIQLKGNYGHIRYYRHHLRVDGHLKAAGFLKNSSRSRSRSTQRDGADRPIMRLPIEAGSQPE